MAQATIQTQSVSDQPATHAAPAPVGQTCPFSAAEQQAFRDDDLSAARHVGLILFSILSAAVIGYTFICLWVASN
jgi:hypothetical protein